MRAISPEGKVKSIPESHCPVCGFSLPSHEVWSMRWKGSVPGSQERSPLLFRRDKQDKQNVVHPYAGISFGYKKE